MQENLNDNCLALCDNAWVFYSLAAPGIFVGADVCAISHDKHQKFFRSCLTDTSFSHIPGLFFCTNTVDFFLIIFPKVLSSSSTRFSAATDLSANVSKHMAIPHNSKCRYGERGAADAKPKAQIILDAAKVSAASGGNNEPKQGQRSQSARGFCPEARCGYRNPTLSSILATQLPERCLSRKAGIVRCCLIKFCNPLYLFRFLC